MERKKINSGKLIKFSWKTFVANWKLLTGTFVLSIVLLFIPLVATFNTESQSFLLRLFLNLIYYAVYSLCAMGMINISLKLVRGKKASVSDLFSCWSKIPIFLLANILYGIIITVGFLLLIFPGCIWMTRYKLFQFFIVDKEQGVFEALRSSDQTTFGAKWDYFAFLLVLAALYLGGILCLGIGLLIANPIIAVAHAAAYEKLLEQTVSEPAREAVQTPDAPLHG